jgi:tryptophanyl-tRNA synthetase
MTPPKLLLLLAALTIATTMIARPCLSFAPVAARALVVWGSPSRVCVSYPSSSSSSSAMRRFAEAATSSPEAAEASSSSSSPIVKRRPRTRRILSGVQPTGSLHLGNYLGAIRQWVEFQNTGKFLGEGRTREDARSGTEEGTTADDDDVNENFFCVVDMHAITVPQDPSSLEESTLSSAALYIASGIDPSRSKVFVQSHVPAHAELAWLLNCVTPMNWLERMIQYKDKSKKAGTNDAIGVGLFTYPVLMAADILLYQADRVPVGEDQRQHLELARDIVRRFNSEYCRGNSYKARCKRAGLPSRPVFTEPEAMIIPSGEGAGVARVMSLTDGNSKMSKSDPNDYSRINVLDPPDLIRDKIRKCKTDSHPGGIEWDNPDRPEATNLLNIYAAVQPHRPRSELYDEVRGMKWGDFKPKLADAIVSHLEPIQMRYAEVRADEGYLRGVLREGSDAADVIARGTLTSAKVAMGFSIPN